MKRNVILWTVPVLMGLFLSLSAFQSSPADVSLKLNLKAGQEFKQWSQTDQKITQILMGKQQDMQQKMGFGYVYKVLRAQPGRYEVERSIYRVLFEVKARMMASFSYDSDKKQGNNPEVEEKFKAFLNKKIVLILNDQGEVLEIKGLKRMQEEIALEIGGDSDKIGEEMGLGALGLPLGKDHVKSMTEAMLAIYPSGPVKTGSNWTKKGTIQGFVPFSVESEYTLREISTSQLLADIESVVESLESDQMDGGYADIGGTQEGSIRIDPKSGWVIEMKAKQHLSGEIGDGKGMSMPIMIETEILHQQIK